MELKFRCGKCHRKLEATATMAGAVVSCPNCGSDVTIPEAALEPGVTLAGFRIEKEIGRGAMGRVFLATQLTMARRVALKVMPRPRVLDSEFVERFFQEVRLAARLEHPNIVTAFDAGEDHGFYYFAMAFVDGETLDTRVKRDGPLPEKTAIGLAVGVAEALSYAWDHSRILHRDIKPANIMVDADGRPMVMDMGIAKNAGDDSHLTATGVAVGTPHYMSPEQARGGHDLDFRTDMYSLGATLFHLVSGRVPYTGTSAMEVIAKHLHDPVPPVRSVRPEVGQDVEAVIGRMMAKDRAHRYSSWEACIRDLHALLKGKTPETTKARLARQASEHLVQQRTFAAAHKAAAAPGRSGRARPLLLILLFCTVLAGVAVVVAKRVGRTPLPATNPKRPATAAAVDKARASDEARKPVPAPPAATRPQEAAPNAAPAAAGTAPARVLPAAATVKTPASTPAATAPAAEAPGPAPAAAPPAASAPVPAPAPADPFALALDQVTAELIENRLAAAEAAWERACAAQAAANPNKPWAEVTDALSQVSNVERRILESYRKNMGTPLALHLKDRQCRVLIKAVTPPTVRTLELLDNGSLGGSFTLADLDVTEKLGRLPAPDTPEAALNRGLVALWDDRLDLAVPELRLFETPLSRALLARLERRASEQREETAERACTDLFRQVLRSVPPREPDKLVAALRERLDTDKRRDKFAERVQAYATSFKDTTAGARNLALLNAVLACPFPGSPWTVPGVGMEFAWVEPLGAWAGVHEVTNAQYRAYAADHNSATEHDLSLNGDDQPAVWLSFDDAEGFAAFLTRREQAAGRLPAGFRYRLPLADEWTTLASCGDTRRFPWGEDWPPPPEVNCNGSEWPGPEPARVAGHTDPFAVTCPVASSGRNSWGLFGLSANAAEWTAGANGTSPELRGNAWCGSGGGHSSPSGYTVKAAWPRANTNFRSAATGLRLLLAKEPQAAQAARAAAAPPPAPNR